MQRDTKHWPPHRYTPPWDISAVICDRLHPDGTTLRNGKALEWYSQFYDAREIIDLDVRPDLGVTW